MGNLRIIPSDQTLVLNWVRLSGYQGCAALLWVSRKESDNKNHCKNRKSEESTSANLEVLFTRITWGYAPNIEVWCLSHLTLSLSLSNWYQWRMRCTSPSEICRTENAVCCFSSISKKPPCILGWRKIRQDMDLRSSALVSRRQEPLKMRFNLHFGHLSFWVRSLSSIQTQWLWISSDL